jgi:hypothetical protein
MRSTAKEAAVISSWALVSTMEAPKSLFESQIEVRFPTSNVIGVPTGGRTIGLYYIVRKDVNSTQKI